MPGADKASGLVGCATAGGFREGGAEATRAPGVSSRATDGAGTARGAGGEEGASGADTAEAVEDVDDAGALGDSAVKERTAIDGSGGAVGTAGEEAGRETSAAFASRRGDAV